MLLPSSGLILAAAMKPDSGRASAAARPPAAGPARGAESSAGRAPMPQSWSRSTLRGRPGRPASDLRPLGSGEEAPQTSFALSTRVRPSAATVAPLTSEGNVRVQRLSCAPAAHHLLPVLRTVESTRPDTTGTRTSAAASQPRSGTAPARGCHPRSPWRGDTASVAVLGERHLAHVAQVSRPGDPCRNLGLLHICALTGGATQQEDPDMPRSPRRASGAGVCPDRSEPAGSRRRLTDP
jgi:hypothetical protein